MTKRFKAVGKRQLLSHAVEEAIEESIRNGQLVPGMKMPSESELCEQFSVSRTVLREALRMLSGRGLLRIEKGRGIFVNKLSPETVTIPLELYLHQLSGPLHSLDVIRARQIIEPPIAAEAALQHTGKDAFKLKKNLEELMICQGGSTLTALDMAFHRYIAEASRNPVVPLLIQPIYTLMPQIKSSVHQVIKDAKETAITGHQKILDAILQGEPEKASAAMAEHLDMAELHVRQMLQTQVSTAQDGEEKHDDLRHHAHNSSAVRNR